MTRNYYHRLVAVCVVLSVGALATAIPGGGGGPPSCYKNHPDDACAHYVDLTPECPDEFYGGGQCGNPMLELNGQTSTSPTNPDCIVGIKKLVGGVCTLTSILTVTVSCDTASGSSCGSGS